MDPNSSAVLSRTPCWSSLLQMRTQWHDLIEHHCPRFGQTRMVGHRCLQQMENGAGLLCSMYCHTCRRCLCCHALQIIMLCLQVAIPIHKPGHSDQEVTDYRLQFSFDGRARTHDQMDADQPGKHMLPRSCCRQPECQFYLQGCQRLESLQQPPQGALHKLLPLMHALV